VVLLQRFLVCIVFRLRGDFEPPRQRVFFYFSKEIVMHCVPSDSNSAISDFNIRIHRQSAYLCQQYYNAPHRIRSLDGGSISLRVFVAFLRVKLLHLASKVTSLAVILLHRSSCED
jgi:hypothetical protein